MSHRRLRLWGWGVAFLICLSAPAPEHTVLRDVPLLIATTTTSGALSSKGFVSAHCKIVFRKHDEATLTLSQDNPEMPALGASVLSEVTLAGQQAKNILHWWTQARTQPFKIRVPNQDTLTDQFNHLDWQTESPGGYAAGFFVSPVVVLSAEHDFEPIFFSRWRFFSTNGENHEAILPLYSDEAPDVIQEFPGLNLHDKPYLHRMGIAFEGNTVNALTTLLPGPAAPGEVPATVYGVLTKELIGSFGSPSIDVHILEIPTPLLRFPNRVPNYEADNPMHEQWKRNALPSRRARQEVRRLWRSGNWIRLKVEADSKTADLEARAASLAEGLSELLKKRETDPGLGRAKFSFFWPHFCAHLISNSD